MPGLTKKYVLKKYLSAAIFGLLKWLFCRMCIGIKKMFCDTLMTKSKYGNVIITPTLDMLTIKRTWRSASLEAVPP